MKGINMENNQGDKNEIDKTPTEEWYIHNLRKNRKKTREEWKSISKLIQYTDCKKKKLNLSHLRLY